MVGQCAAISWRSRIGKIRQAPSQRSAESAMGETLSTASRLATALPPRAGWSAPAADRRCPRSGNAARRWTRPSPRSLLRADRSCAFASLFRRARHARYGLSTLAFSGRPSPMTRPIRLLVVDGNVREDRETHRRSWGLPPGESYAAVVQSLENAAFATWRCRPTRARTCPIRRGSLPMTACSSPARRCTSTRSTRPCSGRSS